MSDVPEDDTHSPDEEKLSATFFLLLAVLSISPPAIAFASIFFSSSESVLIYFLIIIALTAIFLSKLYHGKVKHPRNGWALSRNLRILAFAAYVVVLIAVIGVLVDSNTRPGREIEELVDEVATDMFLFFFPIHGLLVTGFTLLSLTFRAARRDFVIDAFLAFLLFVLPLLNIALFFRGT